MSTQTMRARAFHALHVPGQPVVLYNVWDAGSARAVADAGAAALATGSASVALANGYSDGERVPFDLVLGNATRIVAATDLPVSLDLERGYGADPAAVGESVTQAIGVGVIGCNIEDSLIERGPLRDIEAQCARIRAARAAADRADLELFINARTDVFFQKPEAEHDAAMADEAIARAKAYAEAGANGLFTPLLHEPVLIERVAAESPLPLNIITWDGKGSPADLARLGVARVSYGPAPYRAAMNVLQSAAASVFESKSRA